MDFLKEVLGEDFESFKTKVEKYNQTCESPLKLANLSDGGYVSREKYDALSAQVDKIREECAKPYKDEIEGLKREMEKAENGHKIDMLIKNSGAKNLKAVKALLELEGADEESVKLQLEKIREDNEYLFEKPFEGGATGMRQGSARKETSAEEELKKRLFGK